MILTPSGHMIRGGVQQILGGVLVVPAVQEMLTGYLERATTVVLSSGLAHHELQRICSDPALAELSLSLANGSLTISRPPRPEEMAGRVSQAFAVSRPAGFKTLALLRGHLPQDAQVSVIRENLSVIAAQFAAEEIKAEGFAALLDCLAEIGDHGLNRAFLEAFTANHQDCASWTETLLLFFREKFPNERCYHEADGDFNFGMKSYQHAWDAYFQAQTLSPHNAKVKGNVRNTKEALKRESAERGVKFKRSVGELWQKCAAGDQAAAVSLRQLAGLQAKVFFELIGHDEPFLRDEGANLAVYETLAASAESEGLQGLAGRFRRLGDELVAGVLERLARGSAMNESRLELVERLVKEKAIEQIGLKLLKELAKASVDPTNRHQALCSMVYDEFFAGRHFEASDEYFAAGRLDKALKELRLILDVNPWDELAQRNIAAILAQQSKQALAAEDSVSETD